VTKDKTGDPVAVRKLFAADCKFIWGAQSIDGLPPQTLPEIAFAGRSNVGKSSLINAITGRKALARVSQTPGRTREINFFDLSGKLMLVDLPGYGFAKASKALAAEWQTLIFAYLRGRANLKRVMLLIDSRRGVMELDEAVMTLLDKSAVSYCIALTKTDSLSAPALDDVRARVDAAARKHTAAYPQIFATSAEKAAGLEQVQSHMAALAQL
jgi:GTP-binding protein